MGEVFDHMLKRCAKSLGSYTCYSCYGSVKVTYSFCLLGCHTEGKRDGGMHTSCFMNALMSWI